MKIRWLVVLLCGLLQAVYAELIAPEIFLKQQTEKVLQDFSDPTLNDDRQRANQMIEAYILPHVDLKFMARWIIGRQAWQKGSSEQQKNFTDNLKILLINTYSSTFFAFKDRKLEYIPSRKQESGKQFVQVTCLVSQPNGQAPISMMYQLKAEQDKWLIIDILVEGVSMLKGLQAQFADSVRTQGIEGAIAQVKHQLDAHPKDSALLTKQG